MAQRCTPGTPQRDAGPAPGPRSVRASGRLRRAGLALVVGLLMTAPRAARAEWRRNADVVFSTAYTLQEGALAMGLVGPLDIGVSDTLQLGVHPILLLVGKPSVALRYRLTPVSPVTFALSAGASWSFIGRVDAEGRDSAAAESGFPGSAHLTLLATIALRDDLILTAGLGLGADFLGDRLVRGLVPLQLGLHWRAGPSHLVMAQALGQVATDDGALRRPALQLLYGYALSPLVQVTLGLSLGPLTWQTESRARTLSAFPLADLWFRF
jgi:hypothetical protein